MKITFCTPEEKKRYVNYLVSRYGISISILNECAWITYGLSVFMISKTWEKILIEKELNLFSVGIQAFTNGKEFQPTANFITLMGEHITQNCMELPEGKLLSFFQGKSLSKTEAKSIRVLSDGWVAVSSKGKVVGSASLKGNHLIPNLPGHVHASESE